MDSPGGPDSTRKELQPDRASSAHHRAWVHRRLASDLLLRRHRCIESAKGPSLGLSPGERLVGGPIGTRGLTVPNRGRSASLAGLADPATALMNSIRAASVS